MPLTVMSNSYCRPKCKCWDKRLHLETQLLRLSTQDLQNIRPIKASSQIGERPTISHNSLRDYWQLAVVGGGMSFSSNMQPLIAFFYPKWNKKIVLNFVDYSKKKTWKQDENLSRRKFSLCKGWEQRIGENEVIKFSLRIHTAVKH